MNFAVNKIAIATVAIAYAAALSAIAWLGVGVELGRRARRIRWGAP